MAGQSMFLSPGGFHAGAGRCDDAAASALTGAEVLRDVHIETGIFGDFESAHDFHLVASTVHDQHVVKFATHANHLAGLSGKGQRAAQTFVTADQESEESINRQMRRDE